MSRRVIVVGGGPAGLRAAEVASTAGAEVLLFDAMPSVGRKFLVAGRGGLNITNSEPHADMIGRYSDGPWASLLERWGPADLCAWVEGFSIPTFVGSGRRVYPEGMKSAPLLRRWVLRLREQGVVFFARHRWLGMQKGARWNFQFATPTGERTFDADSAVFALGGASWPQTGSNGDWVTEFKKHGVSIHPFAPANCGWDVAWPSDFLARCEGKPLKNITGRVGGHISHGELLITRNGLEGGVIYSLGRALRSMDSPVLSIDLKPAFSLEELTARMSHAKRLHFHEAFERWRIPSPARALLESHPRRAEWSSIAALAQVVKKCPVLLERPRPISEAISSAGGICWSEVDKDLMLRRLPGIFVAGEMLDWEAPTGGFLMQGCFTTGTISGQASA